MDKDSFPTQVGQNWFQRLLIDRRTTIDNGDDMQYCKWILPPRNVVGKTIDTGRHFLSTKSFSAIDQYDQ
jgi:hypothetical protein